MSAVALSVSLSTSSSMAMIRTVSQLVYEHCRNLGMDPDSASRFRMAAQELTENIVKYSTGSQVKLEIACSADRRLCVRASNEASDVRLQEVERHLTELMSTKDPLALYDRLIRESAPLRDVSGLGLVRLLAEGNFDLAYAIEGNILTITACADQVIGEGQ